MITSCEHGNELSGSKQIPGISWPDEDYQLLDKDYCYTGLDSELVD
jgi:hypothetical protein